MELLLIPFCAMLFAGVVRYDQRQSALTAYCKQLNPFDWQRLVKEYNR